MLASVVLLLLSLLAADPSVTVVTGVVRSERTGEPLRSAVVEVLGAGAPISTVSDASGRYTLSNVPGGRQVLRASHVGYAPLELEVIVPGRGVVELDLDLELRPVPLHPVTVRVPAIAAPPDSVVTVALPSRGSPEMMAIGASPGFAEMGLAEAAEAARTAAGQDPIDPSDVLYVRGAAADLKLVLLDGAPVYAPFHLAGLIQPFEPELLSSANLYLGGAPARYDGGLSYVLDLNTRRGRTDRFHSTGSMDMVAAQARVDGPIGERFRFLAGGRTVHGWGPRSWAGEHFPYDYDDGILLLDLVVPGDGVLALTAFANREAVELDSVGTGPRRTSWSNTAISGSYTGTLGAVEAEITAAVGDFEAALPLGKEDPLLVEGLNRHIRFAADFGQDLGPVYLRYGGSYDNQRLDFRARRIETEQIESPLLDAESQEDALGAYVDGSWQVNPRIRLRAGLRGDFFSKGLDPTLGPRAALTWMVTERAALTLAGGRYHQYVQVDSLVVQDSTPIASAFVVAAASHATVALDQTMGDGFRIGIEAFFKDFEGIPADNGENVHASGLDFWVRRGTGHVTGWVGYSLAWVWSIADGELTTDQFAGRHLLTSGIAGPLGHGGRFFVRFGYGAGLPYTSIPSPARGGLSPSRMRPSAALLEGGGEDPGLPDDGAMLAPAPDDAYIRLDLEVARTWTLGWGSLPVQLTPYLKVINALDRRDTLFYRYDASGGETPRALAALPILPVAGIQWRF